jgi:hypothetical protein
MPTVLRFHGSSVVNGRGTGLPSAEQHQFPTQLQQQATDKLQVARLFCGFWLMGLINNAAYVIMIAGANEIAASAVGK